MIMTSKVWCGGCQLVCVGSGRWSESYLQGSGSVYQKLCLRSLYSLWGAMLSLNSWDVDSRRAPYRERRRWPPPSSPWPWPQAPTPSAGHHSCRWAEQLPTPSLPTLGLSIFHYFPLLLSPLFSSWGSPAQPGLLNYVQQQRWAAQSAFPLWHRAPRSLLAFCCWQAEGRGRLAHLEGSHTKYHCMALGCGRQMKGISKSTASYFYLRKGWNAFLLHLGKQTVRAYCAPGTVFIYPGA